MDRQNLVPHQVQPITRITVGQLPAELTELTEEALSLNSNCSVSSSFVVCGCAMCACSYDGDEAE